MSNLCWIRRDLRLHDHLALSQALKAGETTLVFIFDEHILLKLKDRSDKRVTFIYQSLCELEKSLQKKGSSIIILYGKPEEEIPNLAKKLNVENVFSNRDYEPYAKERDKLVAKKLSSLGIGFEQFKDSVFFEQQEVLKGDGSFYKVFTPYKNKWLEKFEQSDRNVPDYKCNLKNLRSFTNSKNILEHNWYKDIGFQEDFPLLTGGTKAALKRLENFDVTHYERDRNFPAVSGTSYLSVYLRFGNISVRDVMRKATSESSQSAKIWLSEIIWRDFYQMILDIHPYIVKSAIKPEYDKIKWKGKEKDFIAWKEGRTGFPIIDGAMRCLNETGMMHNRLRMIVASFLCKILLIDWRKGEEYFAEKLLDFDLAANNGGWQWSSSSGYDAQPYFRIFNPYSQSEKFDSEGRFIRRWVPELRHLSNKEIHRPDPLSNPNYPSPVVNYEINRLKCLDMYSVVKNKETHRAK